MATSILLPVRLVVPAAVGALSTSVSLNAVSKDDFKDEVGTMSIKENQLRRRLTPLGRTSLLTEAETNISVPMFMLRIKGRLNRDDLVHLLNSKLIACERFSSRIEISPNKEDAHFIPLSTSSSPYDVSEHVKPLYVCGVKENHSEEEKYAGLRSFLSSIANTPIDMPVDKPQWEVLISQPPPMPTLSVDDKMDQVVTNWWESLMNDFKLSSSSVEITTPLKNETADLDDETVLIFRIHHALADGVSVAALLSSLTDEGDDLFKALLSGVKKPPPSDSSTNQQDGNPTNNLRKKDKKKKGIFDMLGKMVRMMMKVVAGLSVQFSLLPFLLLK